MDDPSLLRFREVEAILDGAACAVRDLADADAAGVLLGNLDWLRTRGWRIWAATVMPSHLHVVLRNTDGRNDALDADLGQFKNYTARLVNARKDREGTFWQRENFDHWCRDMRQWLGFVRYTLRNPVAARLAGNWREWPWTVVDPEAALLVDGSEDAGLITPGLQ